MSKVGPGLSDSVQSMFATHHGEIRRRSALLREGEVNSSTFARVDSHGLDDPYVNPEQQFVVFSLSTKEFAPVPEKLENPAVCIYGTFETMADAYAYARVVQTEHPEFSILVDATHKWIVAASTMEHLTSPAFVETHTKKLLDRHSMQLQKNKEEFEENVREQKAGVVKVAEEKPVASTSTMPTRRIHDNCRIHEQRLVAVSFVQDDGDVPEFLFRVYACYDTEDAMNKYVCNTCGDRVSTFDIDVIKTGTWAHPQRMIDGKSVAREVYRSSELNNVMNTHKKTPQEVERFYQDVGSQPSAEASAAPRMQVSHELRGEWEMVGQESVEAEAGVEAGAEAGTENSS